uniref:Peptidase M20 dimerisation domain-containing protein n=1 Tax=Salmo trutta TaxID=8032 RepID=A0A673ZDG8_SALTR
RDSKGGSLLQCAALMFLDRIAEELGLPINKIEVCPGRVVSIMTWEGTNPALKTILLNSHTDCVPVYHMQDAEGNIYSFTSPSSCIPHNQKGSCSMSPIGTYIQAIRRLKADGRKFTRTIHLMFVTDEEVGGLKGMETFVKLPEFQKLNISFALDEGLANPGEAFTVFYGERNPWCDPGENVINSFLDYREKEKVRLNTSECFTLGDVTTINVTMVKVGVAKTVIPAEMDVSFDLRIPPTVNLQVCAWVIVLITQFNVVFTMSLFCDPWWNIFSTTCKAMNMTLEKEIFPAARDSRGYLKIMFVLLLVLALSAIGFSPMNWTPILLHNHNEYLNEQRNAYMQEVKGIQVYEKLVPALANMPALLCHHLEQRFLTGV